MDHKKIISSAIIYICLIACSDHDSYFDRKYEGFWAETWWTYEFKHNGQFIFKSEGHYGNVIDSGFYLIKDSLMFLNPTTDWRVLHEVLKTKLKIVDSNCLRDFNSNYYCLSLDSLNYLNNKEWTFQEKVIDILDTLQIVKFEKEKISSRYPKTETLDFEITHCGIIVVDNKEYHQFDLTRFDLEEGQLIYLRFLASKIPFDIYEYNSSENKLSSVLTRIE